jgi:hypothetical protein
MPAGKPRSFVWIDPGEGGELTYVKLACQMWVQWSGLRRFEVQARARTRTKTIAETNPETLRRVEQLCKAQPEPAYPEQWAETLDHTIRGYLGRQPGVRRDIGVVLPEFLFAPLIDVDEKYGAWHWMLIGEALSGATTGASLNSKERTEVTRRLRDQVWEEGDNPIDELVGRLADLAAGPPRMGVRALTVLSRLALETEEVRGVLLDLLRHEPPMFRLFRAFTKLMLDESRRSSVLEAATSAAARVPADDDPATVVADESLDGMKKVREQHLAAARASRQELALKIVGLEGAANPYPGRSLRWEALSAICDAEHFGTKARKLALDQLQAVAGSPDRTWREQAYCAEVVTRLAPERDILPACLKAWEAADNPADVTQHPLAHAGAVLVERSLMNQGLKRAIGAKIQARRGPGADKVRAAATASGDYDPDHWVLDAIRNDEHLRESVGAAIRAQAEALTANLPRKGEGEAKVWAHITARLRFLCEETVLPIAGTRRRRSIDCLSVAGLAGLASDVLLTAIVRPHPHDGPPPAPLWVQELAAHAVGFLRQPDPHHRRLCDLALAAQDHITAATDQPPGSPLRHAQVGAAHAALWGIGDASGLRRTGYNATALPHDGTTAKRVQTIHDVLHQALQLPPDPDLAPIRWAAAYTLRYCQPAQPLPLPTDERDPIVASYQKLDLTWVRPTPTAQPDS